MTDFNSEIDVISEWNKNAEARHTQIISKIDVSYHEILIPSILKLLGEVQQQQIIDVGCGSGVFANELAKMGAFVSGVDPTENMIKIARREYGYNSRVQFHLQTVQDFANSTTTKFDLAICNMSLITIVNMDDAVTSIGKLLKPKGKFIFNITHPCFWNDYKQYEKNNVFEYNKEHVQKAKFVISNDKQELPSPTTHFHRPLEKYFQCLDNASFSIDKVIEPFPTDETMKKYPAPWKFPRFLSIKCTKITN